MYSFFALPHIYISRLILRNTYPTRPQKCFRRSISAVSVGSSGLAASHSDWTINAYAFPAVI